MGYRTLVILYNDQASQWENDPELGKKIARAMSHAMGATRDRDSHLGYGQVVECAHADTQTLGIVNCYDFKPVAHGHWYRGQADEAMQLQLLKDAADKLGFRLTKKPVKK